MKTGGKNANKQSRWFLEHLADKVKEWMVAITPVPFIIGRDEDANLRLESRLVSRHHAEIRTSGRLLWIRDLGSTNGTFVNHIQIERAELIDSDDIITIGKSEFRVKSVESAALDLSADTCAMDFSERISCLAFLEPRLRMLLRERNVVPHFQPVLSFPDMQVVGYEILGRISQDDLPSNPGELFEIAECLGCAFDLSALFREVGVEVGRSLPGAPLLFANTNPVELGQMSHLLDSLEKIHDLALSSRIVLEINEKAITHTDEMLRLRDALKRFNIGLAYDDFGVGQVRLIDLAEIPPDFLKFDISLISKIHLAPLRLQQMVSTFVRAAQDLGIATLAEGIETPEEAETCRQLGFDFAQGYYYGKPLPITEMEIAQSK